MKCFIHFDAEAVAACRTCGKGMCAACSAYSNHSGVCPECRKKEFEEEVSFLEMKNKDLKWGIVKAAATTILLFWTIGGLIVGGVRWYSRKKEYNKNVERIFVLSEEIKKLEKALTDRGTTAFV